MVILNPHLPTFSKKKKKNRETNIVNLVHDIVRHIEMMKLCQEAYLWENGLGEAAEKDTEAHRFQNQAASSRILGTTC